MSPYGKSHIVLTKVDDSRRRRALNLFGDLLAASTHESDWQSFFNENPFVLTDTLGLNIAGLYSELPLLSGRPDYTFYCRYGHRTSDYGVIELKRPSHTIVGNYSTRHIIPSKNLKIAEIEARNHLDAIDKGDFLDESDYFVAGNRRHAFIIIGHSEEITEKCKSEIFLRQFNKILPPGFHLYTYDEVLQLFASRLSPKVFIAFATPVTEYIGHVKGVEFDGPAACLSIKLRDTNEYRFFVNGAAYGYKTWVQFGNIHDNDFFSAFLYSKPESSLKCPSLFGELRSDLLSWEVIKGTRISTVNYSMYAIMNDVTKEKIARIERSLRKEEDLSFSI